jgi:hypothetical protein
VSSDAEFIDRVMAAGHAPLDEFGGIVNTQLCANCGRSLVDARGAGCPGRMSTGRVLTCGPDCFQAVRIETLYKQRDFAILEWCRLRIEWGTMRAVESATNTRASQLERKLIEAAAENSELRREIERRERRT